MLRILTLLASFVTAHAGSLRIDISHYFETQPLRLNSFRYTTTETFSFTRLSYLLSDFAIQSEDDTWDEIPGQFAYIDYSRHRTHFTLRGVPEGSFKALRFSVGVPKILNHADPTKFSADHPLNPNLNQLHWDWTGGYIFMALEGRYRSNGKSSGFVYHLANEENLTPIEQAVPFRIQNHTSLHLSFDLQKLFSSISFEKDGRSTHSHTGDPIAKSLVKNLQRAFSVNHVAYPPAEAPRRPVQPLYLPETYQSYSFKMSSRFPIPQLPRDNPLLHERVALGEFLFHDKRLSVDSSISCASCHDPQRAFSDNRPLSSGVGGRLGTRNSMPLFNLAWKSNFFWDGRAKSLREQVLLPIQDHHEMASDLDDVIAYLEKTQRPAFEKAFGPGEVTSEKIALALENFLLTLTSYESKFDRAMAGKEQLTESEQRGMDLFFTEYEPRSNQFGADCFHCHGGANFSDHQLHDNGLGESVITPSLRNLTLTAPYMHDGRFATLEDVVGHYSGPIEKTTTLDPNLAKHPGSGLQLSESDQKALVDFLKTLTDE